MKQRRLPQQFGFGHWREACSDRVMPVQERLEQAGTRDGHQGAGHDDNGPGPKAEVMTEPNPGIYGPWMMVQNQRRKNRGPMGTKPSMTQMNNRFEVLREEGGTEVAKASYGKEKGKGKAQVTVGSSIQSKQIDQSPVSTSFAMVKDKKGAAGSLGKANNSNIKIRDQEAEIGTDVPSTPQSTSTQLATTSNQSTFQPASSNSKLVSTGTRVANSKPRTGVPPDKNRGGRREPFDRSAQARTEQSSGELVTRERSISPHHLRMVEQGSIIEDNAMEASRSETGPPLHFNDPIPDNGGELQSNQGLSGN
ncbi:uncharacterized protein LOC114315289 [Camellia sinensis]|uniref:uncharacterized protein LOC114315289 n=1 Tax=Camellia sinensis TaxID=4442 RepID=UPI0010369140|nr:uncharacterized protein LOC114315289 [Camellia sinensis]